MLNIELTYDEALELEFSAATAIEVIENETIPSLEFNKTCAKSDYERDRWAREIAKYEAKVKLNERLLQAANAAIVDYEGRRDTPNVFIKIA